MRNWKKLFSTRILERGYDYYAMGMITSLKKKKYGYEALVEGNDEYEVEIHLKDDEVEEMYCNCPYAEEGNNCKHMAAVLYEITDEDFDEKYLVEDTETSHFEKEDEDIEQTINKIPEEELKEFLIILAKENETVKNAIFTRFSSFDGNEIHALLHEIDIITNRHSRRGYIDYYNTWEYGNEMSAFLEKNADILLKRGKVKETFHLVNEIFKEVASQELDDSDGMIGMLTQECVEYWKKIIELSDETFRKTMFQYFKQSLKDGIMLDYMEDVIEEILLDSFNDKSILGEKLKYIDSEINYLTKKYKTDYYVSYKLSNFVKQRLLVMHELDYSSKEIIDYRNQYRFFAAIRQMEINEYIGKKDYKQAVEVLKESIEIDKSYYGLVHDYKKQLVDVYEKMKDVDAYETYLKDYVINETQYDLEYILKLKSISTQDEWSEYREIIIQNGTNTNVSYYLLEKEENYSRLLEEIKKTNDVHLLDKFEKKLKSKLPKETMMAYCDYVLYFTRVASNRSMYKEAIQYLKKIKTYPNADEVLENMISNFKIKYKRRSAMIDELQKAGF